MNHPASTSNDSGREPVTTGERKTLEETPNCSESRDEQEVVDVDGEGVGASGKKIGRVLVSLLVLEKITERVLKLLLVSGKQMTRAHDDSSTRVIAPAVSNLTDK